MHSSREAEAPQKPLSDLHNSLGLTGYHSGTGMSFGLVHQICARVSCYHRNAFEVWQCLLDGAAGGGGVVEGRPST